MPFTHVWAVKNSNNNILIVASLIHDLYLLLISMDIIYYITIPRNIYTILISLSLLLTLYKSFPIFKRFPIAWATRFRNLSFCISLITILGRSWYLYKTKQGSPFIAFAALVSFVIIHLYASMTAIEMELARNKDLKVRVSDLRKYESVGRNVGDGGTSACYCLPLIVDRVSKYEEEDMTFEWNNSMRI